MRSGNIGSEMSMGYRWNSWLWEHWCLRDSRCAAGRTMWRWTCGQKWGCGCDEKVEDVPEEMMPAKKNLTLEEFLEISHDIDSERIKC